MAAETIDAAARFGSGRAVQRIEDRALLTGAGRFTDNVPPDGAAFIAFQRSPHAHARIVAVDADLARTMPGVLGVYTGAELVSAGVQAMPTSTDFRRADGRTTVTPPRRALAHEFARFVGEPVVAVVAETREAARDAAEAVFVEYEDLPAVVDARAAVAAGAVVVTGEAPDNIAAEMRHGDAAGAAEAFARAAVRIELDLVNQRVAPVSMEPRSIVASFDAGTGRITVRISNQMPTAVAAGLSGALGLAQDRVHVLVGDVGGGFGMKTGIYPEDIVVAHAARSLGRAVRWQADRSEDFLSASHGRDVSSRAELALDGDGRALALRVHSLANVGAYATGTGVAIQLLIGPWVSTSVYAIPVIDLHLQAVLSHTTPTGAYRGAGRPEAIYLIERLFDAAAREMKLDPAELRRRNLLRPEQMPYTNPMGQTYDSGAFEKILDQGLALAEWSGYATRREATERQGKLRGRGIAAFLEWTGGMAFEEKVSVDVTPAGTIEIFSATQAMGQGIATSYAQLAVDIFGVPIERIRIVQGDTDRGNGFGSAGSRSLFTGGSAVRVASERTIEHAKALAGEALEASASDIEYRAGRFAVVGTDVGIDLFALAGRQPEARIHLDSTSTVGGATWPNACHVCEVEVDPDTGDVRVAAYASVNDIGRVISPTIARGQVEGGAVQGLGQALCEQVVYDAGSSQLVTGSLMDYAVPRAADVGVVFRTEFDTSIPCALNPLGVKGVGELGTIGATPAVMNAVIDALAAAGLGRAAEALQMPATPARVWQLLHGAGSA
ncbi:MAG TPA: xanthine dehydrogenase family protein molybdopterin-binding subunit [Caldimonas sp.]|jgi:carbon-monoxide dehydrogenase large subunit|nr:xanthine dehydrogenase family protein molybdopterin-binding subunit [Caldimonas sp.]HEX2542770.1 xanthine dehydrogenase family protein molybdopterin-binding subunit [Caldimonas sp.]